LGGRLLLGFFGATLAAISEKDHRDDWR
jgi:hypothetical protein